MSIRNVFGTNSKKWILMSCGWDNNRVEVILEVLKQNIIFKYFNKALESFETNICVLSEDI